jgi:hypothetical protein
MVKNKGKWERSRYGNTRNKKYKFVAVCTAQSAGASLLAQAQPEDLHCSPARNSAGFQTKTGQVVCRIRGILEPICKAIGLKKIPEQSTMCREEHRLKPYLELANVRLVQAVLPERPFATGDGTGLSFTGKSSYYVRRIMGQRGYKRKGYARLVVVNTTKNIILGAGLRVLPTGELNLLRKIWVKLARKPSTLVWDKAGDSEPHHKWLEHDEKVRSIAPVRKGWRRGSFRKKLKDNFPQKTYNKRNHSETTIRLYKLAFGEALKAKSLKGRRAEVAGNVITHNLNQRLKKFFIQMFSTRPLAQAALKKSK